MNEERKREVGTLLGFGNSLDWHIGCLELHNVGLSVVFF